MFRLAQCFIVTSLFAPLALADDLADLARDAARRIEQLSGQLSSRDRAAIRDDLDAIFRVLDDAGGGGGGGDTVSKTINAAIDGGAVAGTTEDARRTAQARYDAACDAFIDQARSYNRNATRITSITCGAATDTGGSNAYRYQSTGVVVVQIPARNTAATIGVAGATAAGTTEVARDQAFASYQAECQRQHEMLSQFRGVFFFECGAATDTGGSNAYRYVSQGQLTYASSVGSSTQEVISGDYVSGTTAESAQAALASWQQRCSRWADIQSIGDTVVAFCGDAADVGGSNGYQYRSTGTVVHEL